MGPPGRHVGHADNAWPCFEGDFIAVIEIKCSEFVAAEFAQSAIQDDIKFESIDACFGSTTMWRRLSMSEEIRIGDL